MSRQPWEVPKLWPGKRIAILASGRSMSHAIAESVLIRGLPTIAVNATFQLAPWADMLFAADAAFWRTYWRSINFAGIKVCGQENAPLGVHYLQKSGAIGFDPDPRFFRSGGNSGYGAVHIAAHAGATEIELHGFDMHGDNGHHWHGSHLSPLRNHGNGIYEGWIKNFDTLAPELEKLGIKVFNCTPHSALRCFPMIDLEKLNVIA